MFALAAHGFFGISDSGFITYYESVLKIIMFMIGETSPFDVRTTLSFVRTIFGLLFIFITLILLSMIIAIIITHYIEYYIETSGEKVGLFSLISQIMLDKEFNEREMKKKKWYKKIPYYCQKVLKRVIEQIAASTLQQSINQNTGGIKLVEMKRDSIDSNAVNMILNKNSSLTRNEVKEEMKHVYFWVELISGTMRRLYGACLFQRNEPESYVHTEHNKFTDDQEDEEFYRDDEVHFIMESNDYKGKVWSELSKFISNSYTQDFEYLVSLQEALVSEIEKESSDKVRKIRREVKKNINKLDKLWNLIDKNKPVEDLHYKELMESERKRYETEKFELRKLKQKNDKNSSSSSDSSFCFSEDSSDNSELESSCLAGDKNENGKDEKESSLVKSSEISEGSNQLVSNNLLSPTKRVSKNKSIKNSRSHLSRGQSRLSKLKSEAYTTKEGTKKKKDTLGDNSSSLSDVSEEDHIDMQEEYRQKIEQDFNVILTHSQLILWQRYTPNKVKIILWFEKMSNYQKVAIWNSCKFPYSHYQQLKKNFSPQDCA